MSEDGAEVLASCRTVAHGDGAGIAEYVISMATAPSDVLAVILLLREAGLARNLPVVPLFETLSDLEGAAGSIDALLSLPWYREYTGGYQQVMLPAWLGTDTALHQALERGDAELLNDMLTWPFYRMQTDMLEMVLAKADVTLARYYAERLTDSGQQRTVDELCERLAGLTGDLLRVTREPHLLADDPELAESLYVRNTYLDPLHLLQAGLLARWRNHTSHRDAVEQALQVTMAGIASGLRNTG